jgi:lipopolysaccharide/colanic/teichoic acid biosynthesis glycosyltransferase
MRQRGWRALAKRGIDVVGAGVALVLSAPILGAAAAAIRWDLGSPVIFTQERAGRNGRAFRIYKFRTMRDAGTGTEVRPETDAARLTKLGSWLRDTSIDELPELWNVLRGDMSLVGPRPLLMKYVPRYSSEQARRLDVLPGLTGWAQINGRNALSWDARFALDTWYVDNWSLGLDLLVIVRTIRTVTEREGVAHDGHATMPEFLGAHIGR